MKKTEVSNLQKILNACDKVGIKASTRWNNNISPAPEVSLNDARTEMTITNGPNLRDKYKLIAISPKHKQIVITVEETADRRSAYRELNATLSKKINNYVLTQKELAKVYKTNTPEGTTFEYQMGLALVNDDQSITHRIHVTAIIPGALQYFLIGYDEKHLFVCQLPEAVKSVEQAHRNLIPLECRGKKYLRQGEYFFLPVAEKQLKEYLTSDKYHYNNQIEVLENANGDESDHTTSMGVALRRRDKSGKISFKEVNLVFGEIKNERHKPLWLSTVHRVFISRERPSTGTNWD